MYESDVSGKIFSFMSRVAFPLTEWLSKSDRRWVRFVGNLLLPVQIPLALPVMCLCMLPLMLALLWDMSEHKL